MNRQRRRMGSAALSVLALPAAMVLSYAPTAPAATVLVAEGSGQPAGHAQSAFNGEFCAQNTCRSVNQFPIDVYTSSVQIQSAISSTPGDIILMGYSLGAASIYDRMRRWELTTPGGAPDPERVKLIVTFGNPENKYGGDDRNIPWLGLPDDRPYQQLEVTMQYDSVADKPARWGFFSYVNNQFVRHFDYFKNVDINDPDNLIYQDGGTTYMLIKADVLPMLKWADWFLNDQQMDQLDAVFRPLVEQDYNRPDYIAQGAGADWGNGTPPPSVSELGTAGDVNRRSGIKMLAAGGEGADGSDVDAADSDAQEPAAENEVDLDTGDGDSAESADVEVEDGAGAGDDAQEQPEEEPAAELDDADVDDADVDDADVDEADDAAAEVNEAEDEADADDADDNGTESKDAPDTNSDAPADAA